MRALVIGRGSMGRRRIRDLTALGCKVRWWDNAQECEWESGKSLDWCELMLVCTPPQTKMPWLLAAWQIGGKLRFTEADIDYSPLLHFPSATPLFTDWYAEMRRCHDQLAYTHWCGQRLEDWHPGATAATYYALRDPSLAIREMVAFELIPITKVYGPVVNAWAVVKTPTFWQIHLDHERGASGSLTIEIESRPAIRHHNTIQMRYSEADYLAEMRALIAAVKGEQPWPYTQQEERANLEVLHTIERSD